MVIHLGFGVVVFFLYWIWIAKTTKKIDILICNNIVVKCFFCKYFLHLLDYSCERSKSTGVCYSKWLLQLTKILLCIHVINSINIIVM